MVSGQGYRIQQGLRSKGRRVLGIRREFQGTLRDLKQPYGGVERTKEFWLESLLETPSLKDPIVKSSHSFCYLTCNPTYQAP